MIKKILFSLIAFYTLFGFVVIPLVLKPQVVSIVAEQTNATVEIDTIYFNPYMFRLEILGLKLSSLDDKKLVDIKSTILNLEFLSLFKAAVHVKEFILEEPEIFLVLDKEKKINFSKIIKPSEDIPKETNTTTQTPRIILDKVAVINGSLNYEDFSQKSKFDFRVDTLGFELKDVDTKDMSTSDAKVRFYLKLEDGGLLAVKSELVKLDPLVVQGSVDYEASKLYSQWRYAQDSLNFEIADGALSFNTQYYVDTSNLSSLTLSNLNASLDSLRIKPKGNHKDVLNLEYLVVENAIVKPLMQDVHIDKIALNSLDLKAKRDADGNIDWLEYIKINGQKEIPKTEVEEESEPSKESKSWNVVLDTLSLEKIKANFQDKGIKPNVENSLDELNIYIQNITLDGSEPLEYQMNSLINSSFKCSSEGNVIHKVLDAKTSIRCSGLDVEHFVPYIDDIAKKELATYNVKLRSLKTSFDANVSARDSNSSIVVDVSNANIALSDFALNKRSTNKRLLTFNKFDVRGIKLNTASKEVFVNDTVLSYPYLRTKKLKSGSISLDNLIVAKKSKESKKVTEKKTTEKEYRVRLNKVSLKGAKVSFEDKQMTPSVKAKIDQIYLTAKNIDSKKNSWMNYYVSARVNGSGKMKGSGSFRHTPLKQKGKLSLNRLSLKEISPYLQESAYVNLDDGYVSFDTKTKYVVSTKHPDLSVGGSFKLEEVFVSDSRDKSVLASFNKLDLKEFTLETAPNRLFVNEVDVNAFYVNAMIDANKTMNFSTLSKIQEINSSVVDENLSETNTTKKDPFPVRVMKINVENGSAKFSDASLPLHFKTDIHGLNGAIYAVSSNPDETSYIDIIGEVDKYGSTKLKGSVNASDPKVFTDIDFNFRNLDLSAMSGYSQTFAGHHIEDGKLFLNLNYDIENSKLKAENSIIVKKIKLGDEVDIEGGSLPLGFVIALLEDNDGVIDIDMPIRGNVDEPDFKYGALVWKTFGNLILKAVASPFKFLGAMLGVDGEELEYVEFETASNLIIPSEREKLDNVAKLLIKRPKILLSVIGTYDARKDKEALQKAKLIKVIVKKSGAKNEEDRISAMTVDLLEDIYAESRDDERLEKIRESLEKKYEDDDFEREYLRRLVKECSNIQVVGLEDLEKLAKQRVQSIQTYLVDTKGIETNRIKILDISEMQSTESELIKSKLEIIVP